MNLWVVSMNSMIIKNMIIMNMMIFNDTIKFLINLCYVKNFMVKADGHSHPLVVG